MIIKQYRHLIFFVLGFVGTALGYWWFVHSPYFPGFNAWSQANLVTFCLVLFAIKVASIVWPPLPGGIFTLGAIPILGWWQAYAIDLAGSMTGSSLAYAIAKKWGMAFVNHIFDAVTVNKIMQWRVRPQHEIEAVFVFRLFGANVAEVVCYGAGLLRLQYWKFLTGSVLAHLIFGIPFYFFARAILTGKSLGFGAAFLATAVILFFVLKKRYFTNQSDQTKIF